MQEAIMNKELVNVWENMNYQYYYLILEVKNTNRNISDNRI